MTYCNSSVTFLNHGNAYCCGFFTTKVMDDYNSKLLAGA